MQAGVRRTLRRGGAVSGAALFFALAAGGMSLASAPSTTPQDAGLLPPGTTAPVTTTVKGLLPTPTPAPSPEASAGSKDGGPVGGLVKTVTDTVDSTVTTATDTVDGLLNPDPKPPAHDGGGTASGGHQHGSTGSTGSHPGSTVTHHHVTSPTVPVTPRLPREALGPAAFGTAGPATLSGSTTTNPGVTAASTPQVQPQATNHIPSLGDLGRHSIPAAIIVIAVTAVAGVAASHIGVWQNRLRPVSSSS